MLKKIEGSIPLTLLLIAAGFLAYGYLTSLLKITDFMIFCIFVLGFDLVYGHMGQLSFGHMLYLGAGAYGAGLSAKYLSPDPFLALAAGLLVAGLVGAVLGPLLVRTTGACFALLNLAFNQVGHFLILVPLAPITGGEDGLSLTFSSYGWVNFSNLNFIFFLVLAVLLAVAFLILKFESSPFGLLLKSVKENEIRVRFLGYNTYFYKWITFIFSAALSGLAGALTVLNYGYTNPSFIDPTRNVEVIFAALMGGAGQVIGAVVGGTAFMTISNYLARYILRWEMFLGVALLLIAFRFRKGLWGYLREI
jgi:branched-chain amino acid transport system permease protein